MHLDNDKHPISLTINNSCDRQTSKLNNELSKSYIIL